MDTNEKVFELLEATNLNWTVEKSQLIDAEKQRETESFGIFRNDTGQWLGTVGNVYTPFQNWEMAQIMVEATHNIGLELSRGGLLSDGRKVYLQASLPDELIGKSNVKQWISHLNSHDGSTSVGFGGTGTVIVCQNTFFRAYGEMSKFRHTTTLKERIAIAQKDLQNSLEANKELVTNFKLMADIKIGDNDVTKVTEKLFNVDLLIDEKKQDISKRRVNQIKSFIDSVKQSVSEQGDSLWALYNGITRYTTHVASPDDENSKTEYLMTGGGRRLSDIGFNQLMKFVEENTEPRKMVTV